MTDVTTLLAGIKTRAAECSAHEEDGTWLDCNQPGRYDGARMAEALASIPRLVSALEAVLTVAVAYESEASHYDTQADRFIEGEVRSRYKRMAEDEREHASAIRTAVVAALGGGE